MKPQRNKTTRLRAAGMCLLALSPALNANPTDPPVYKWGTEASSPPPGFDFPKVTYTLPFDLDSLRIDGPGGTITPPNTKSDPGNLTAITQKEFDIFSWTTFIALNWAADSNGYPITTAKLGSKPTAPRVWENYMAPRDFFKNNGKAPNSWGTPEETPRTLKSPSKKSVHILDEVDEAFFNLQTPMPSITDLNNEYVRYEVRFNKPEYDYMLPFYTYAKQQAHIKAGNSFEFPWGIAAKGDNPGQMGAMELKVAWKKMGPNDDPSKFYTIDATVDDPLSPNNGKGDSGKYGMVGMHIMVRTESAPQWLWATFEHVDNNPRVHLPLEDGVTKVTAGKDANGKKKSYSFWNSAGANSIAGFDMALYEKLVALPEASQGKFYQPKSDRSPSQIAQVVTENNDVLDSEWTNTLNANMQAKLKGTVWENYRLITTQWPSDPTQATTPGYTISLGKPAPISLGNPVLETYLQVNGSCMACHAGATIDKGAPDNASPSVEKRYFTNFSFMLQRAKAPASTTPKTH